MRISRLTRPNRVWLPAIERGDPRLKVVGVPGRRDGEFGFAAEGTDGAGGEGYYDGCGTEGEVSWVLGRAREEGDTQKRRVESTSRARDKAFSHPRNRLSE